ncbi:Probable outer membrane efflux protein precursor [Flavobacterium indicum GPTSA100-9 = DSM 17447]|uniref:Probable outer membrane efflux protein n=1 Tax=Flavobacterium indicum (strain DSM 17447 / CIP 109464 / GPTSA100-9) TaxID=1094466 RepID=H8XNW4_FLAIG|nr:TolC family protein [Flavobacterium indicum]CCG52231.1 Probable outer membrane efflux protein precursor [Flavobacterium indicum GPTSA100-9 = DSM 17447]
MKNKLIIALAFFTSVIQAQVKELTLKDALQYALENKTDAKKAKLDVENSSHQIAEVRAMALPQINLNGGLTYNPILQKSALPGDLLGAPGQVILVPFGQEWNSTAVASLSQNLFNQSVFTGLKAAKTTREFYQVNQQLTEEQLIEKVSSSYYQVYVYQQKLKNAESNLESTKKVKDIITGQYQNGLARKIDLDRISVKVSNLEAIKLQLINAVQLQENTLKFFIGMPMDQQIKLPINTMDVTALAFEQTTEVSKRTEMAVLRKQEELLGFKKKSFLAEYYPSLSLTANYGYQGLGAKMPWFVKPADGVYWTNFSSIGLNLNVPVFNGFSTRSRVRQAEVSLKKIQEDIKDTELALNYQFENAKTQINNSVINVSTQEQNMKLAKEVLDNTKNNYLNGLATLTELLDAENALTEAQNNFTTAQLEYKLAEIQIIKSKGELKNLLN